MVSVKAKNGSPELELMVFKLLILLFFAYLLLPVFGVESFKIFPEKKYSDFRPVYSYEYFQSGLTQAKTEGNQTFIPINIEGRPGEYYNHILTLIREFEEKQNLKVTFFYFEVENHPFTPPFFSSIWLNHEPIK
jgi:hypothetical protein